MIRLLLAPVPGARGDTKAIVVAQMLAQIGAFALPALLPAYIARWDFSKTEAGWLVGIFFAAYVVMVPGAPRLGRPGTGPSDLHAWYRSDGLVAFRVRAVCRWVLVGAAVALPACIGWAGTYMPGLKAIADPLEGTAQSRAVSWHAAGVVISGAASFAIAGLVGNWAGAPASFPLGGATALGAVLIAAYVISRC